MRRILVFGDSLPWGADDLKKGGWVDIFKIYFKRTGEFNEVFNLGNPGRETTRLLRYMESECEARLDPRYKKVDVIMIQIGINDARLIKNKKLSTYPSQFRKNIQKLIDIAKKFVNNIVFVGLTPVDEPKTTPISYNKDAYYKNIQIKQYDQIIKSICKENRIHFIDVYNEWTEGDYRRLLADGLHPNSKGHQKMYSAIIAFLTKNALI